MTRLYAAKTDANQAEIVAALRKAGATVTITARLGNGFPDLVVGRNGATYLLEVKKPGAKLTPDEARFFCEWAGHCTVVRSPEEALQAVGALAYTTQGTAQ